MTAEIDRAMVLAESLRAIRSTAKPHWNGNGRRPNCSLQVSHAGLSDLDDAADMIEKLAAEIERLNAPAVLLTDERIEEIAEALPSRERPGYLNEFLDVLFFAEQIQNATLAANGKAVS